MVILHNLVIIVDPSVLWVGVNILLIVSAGNSICDILRAGAKDPSVFNSHGFSKGLYSKDPESDIAKITDTCFAHGGNGDLMELYAKPGLESTRKEMETANQVAVDGLSGLIKKRNKYESLLEDTAKLQGTSMVDAAYIYSQHKEDDHFANILLLRNEILFSGDREPEIVVKDPAVLLILEVAARSVHEAMDYKDMKLWMGSPSLEGCFKPIDKKPVKIFGLKSHLNVMKEAANELGCLKEMAFCTAEGLCSDIGVTTGKLIIAKTSPPRGPPKWTDTEYKFNMEESDLSKSLETCRGEDLGTDLLKPSCKLYHLNNLIAGMYFALYKISEQDPVSQCTNYCTNYCPNLVRLSRRTLALWAVC